MLKRDEMSAMIDADGETRTAEVMALHLVDDALDALNEFMEHNVAYGHPSVVIPYTIEMLVTIIVETLPKEHWRSAADMAIANINSAIDKALTEQKAEGAEQAASGEAANGEG